MCLLVFVSDLRNSEDRRCLCPSWYDGGSWALPPGPVGAIGAPGAATRTFYDCGSANAFVTSTLHWHFVVLNWLLVHLTWCTIVIIMRYVCTLLLLYKVLLIESLLCALCALEREDAPFHCALGCVCAMVLCKLIDCFHSFTYCAHFFFLLIDYFQVCCENFYIMLIAM